MTIARSASSLPVALVAASALGTLGLAAAMPFACSGSTSACSVDAGASAPSLDAASDVVIADDAGNRLKPFPAGGPADPGPGAVYVTVSGEANAIMGYPFPPNSFTADTYMVDGWEFQIQALIVVIDQVVLWSDPNLSTTNQSLHGPQVAHLTGPFVVDLHKGGTIVGQGGYPEEATALGVIASQNDACGAAFDPTLTYGVGFSTIPAGPLEGYTGKVASYDAYNVNLDDSEADDYAYMVAHGASVYYRGHAVWKGDDPNNPRAPCTAASAGPGPATARISVDGGPDGGVPTYTKDGGYDFAGMPLSGMNFRFAFSTPTRYVNCVNYTLSGMGVGGESNPRGVQVSSTSSAIAQVTIHMDHPFWESFAEDTPVHWDQIAAQYVGVPRPDGGLIEAHLEDFRGVWFQGFTDHLGTPLPWRDCVGGSYTAAGNGQMSFNTLTVPISPHATDPGVAIRDYYDYMRYAQSTQGHLNSQGSCYVDRQFPSPPGGS